MRIDRVKFVAAITARDVTGAELAERAGVSRGTICSVRSGKSCSRETAERLAAALEISVNELLPDGKM